MADNDLANEYKELAEEGLANARSLLDGGGDGGPLGFLERMSRFDRLLDHPDCMTDEGTCGHCMTQWCMAEAARRLLAEGDVLDGVAMWSSLMEELWHGSKYWRLYQEEKAAGRDPRAAFEARGWQM